MKTNWPQMIFFGVLFTAVAVLVFFLIWPFVVVLALAAAGAVILNPVYRRLEKLFGGFSGLAAVVTIVILLVVIIIPIIFLGFNIIDQSQNIYLSLSSDNGVGKINDFVNLVDGKVNNFLPGLKFNAREYFAGVSSLLVQKLGGIFSGTFDFIVRLLLCFVALFYFLKDGKSFKKVLTDLSPLPENQDNMIISTLGKAINSVILGSLAMGVLQGILVGIGLYIFGIPNSVLWGTVAGICSFIPTVGTTLVFIPAIIYLIVYIPGFFWMGLLAWNLMTMVLIDNYLTPKVIQKGIDIHPLLILFSILGGLSFFGPEGFFLGPLVLSLLFVLMKVYKELKING